MRSILFILSSFILLKSDAQTGMEILFTKGAELEYKTTSVRPTGAFKLELYEVTRIILTVTDVKDSNNITYSYITKKGKGIEDPESDNYEKNYVVTREAGTVSIPHDLFFIDTSYLKDKYPKYKKAKGYQAIAKTSGKCTLLMNFEKGIFKYTPEVFKVDFVVRDHTSNPSVPDFSESKYSIIYSTKQMKVEGKTEVKTEAGSFECYKMIIPGKAEMVGLKLEFASVFYFHPQFGFIKTEQTDGKSLSGSIELVRLKK